MYTNAKIKIYPEGIYLLKVNNENFRTRSGADLKKIFWAAVAAQIYF